MLRSLSLMVFAVLSALAWAQTPQVAPWTLEIEEPISVLLFVAPDCAPCTDLAAALEGVAGLVVIAPAGPLPEGAHAVDRGGLASRTFRVTTFPTVVLTLGRQEVLRQAGQVDLEVLEASLAALRDGRMPAPWRVGIEVGARVDGPLRDFTGLVVYWDEPCAGCEGERAQVERLLASGDVAVRVIGKGGIEFGVDDADLVGVPAAWGLPAAPMHVFLLGGVPLWIDAGARDDLEETVRLILGLL